MTTKNALIIIGDGSEDIEVVTTADILRRAGVTVVICSVNDPYTCVLGRGCVIVPDEHISKISNLADYSIVIFPGGLKGTVNVADSSELQSLLTRELPKFIGAICAAPINILYKLNIIGPQDIFTGYPAVESLNKDNLSHNLYSRTNSGEICRYTSCLKNDIQIITGAGPGVTEEWALVLVKEVIGEEVARKVAEEMLCR